jgi:plastocyanin
MRLETLVLKWVPTSFAALLLAAGVTNETTVRGTVTAKGLRSSEGIVVSLHAPGLETTPPKEPVEMDQKGMTFIPHVLPVVKGTTVRFLNSDSVSHNVFSPEGGYNLGTWPRGESREHRFDKPGVYTQLCQIHPEMEAYVVVLDTPYFATTDNEGRFEIAQVPPGEYKLVAWSEKLNKIEKDITVEPGKPLAVEIALG